MYRVITIFPISDMCVTVIKYISLRNQCLGNRSQFRVLSCGIMHGSSSNAQRTYITVKADGFEWLIQSKKHFNTINNALFFNNARKYLFPFSIKNYCWITIIIIIIIGAIRFNDINLTLCAVLTFLSVFRDRLCNLSFLFKEWVFSMWEYKI